MDAVSSMTIWRRPGVTNLNHPEATLNAIPPLLARTMRGIVVVAVGMHAGEGVAQTAPEREVLDVVETWNQAFATNDPDRYFGFIDDDITVLTPSNPYRVEGVPDDREEFEWGIDRGRSRVGYFQELQPHVQLYRDVAVVTYFSRGAYGPDRTVAYLKETDVLVRRDDGWKIVHIHVSATP